MAHTSPKKTSAPNLFTDEIGPLRGDRRIVARGIWSFPEGIALQGDLHFNDDVEIDDELTVRGDLHSGAVPTLDLEHLVIPSTDVFPTLRIPDDVDAEVGYFVVRDQFAGLAHRQAPGPIEIQRVVGGARQRFHVLNRSRYPFVFVDEQGKARGVNAQVYKNGILWYPGQWCEFLRARDTPDQWVPIVHVQPIAYSMPFDGTRPFEFPTRKESDFCLPAVLL